MTVAGPTASATRASVDLCAAIAGVPDPEVPVITIEDLGILRAVLVDEQARTVSVLITPTYSGCPAMDAIRQHIEHVARRRGYVASVRTRLSPAWTTDWMSAAGRDKLREFGIAPPGQRSEVDPQPVHQASHQDAGTHQQHDRESNLNPNEAPAGPGCAAIADSPAVRKPSA